MDTYRRAVAEDRERYPLYGAAAANITPCAYWPYEPAEGPVEVVDEGPTTVLVVQNRRDVPTPHVGGEMLREKFGDRVRLGDHVTIAASEPFRVTCSGNTCLETPPTQYPPRHHTGSGACPYPGARHDSKALAESGIADRWANHLQPGGPGMLADLGYLGTGAITGHRKPRGAELSRQNEPFE